MHYDVAKAHMQVPILRCEGDCQARQISGNADRAAQGTLKKFAVAEMREFETHARSTAPLPEIDLLSELLQEALEEENLLDTVGESERVGHARDVGRFKTGISELRAQRAIGRYNDKVREERALPGGPREGRGRLLFLAGPLELLRPFRALSAPGVAPGPASPARCFQ